MLKLRRVAIDTYHENVAYLHRNCALYRAEGFQALSKVEIQANGICIYAVLNIVDDDSAWRSRHLTNSAWKRATWYGSITANPPIPWTVCDAKSAASG